MGWVKDYFSFSKRERRAFIALLVLIVIFILLPELYNPRRPAPVITSIGAPLSQDSLSPTASTEDEWQPGPEPSLRQPATLFYFDPNTLDEAGFIKLGLPQRTARTIIKYRGKGGRFRRAEDLRKIYSLSPDDADRIIPYARIIGTSNDQYVKRDYRSNYKRNTPVIDINTASQDDWQALPGIGPVLSKRIMDYRERIGGFSSLEQVRNTWGLPDSTFQKIGPFLRLANPSVHKVNINTAFENELMVCPGINRDVAQAIIIYRKQYGPFNTPEDLRKIVFITEEMYRQIIPCIRVK